MSIEPDNSGYTTESRHPLMAEDFARAVIRLVIDAPSGVLEDCLMLYVGEGMLWNVQTR